MSPGRKPKKLFAFVVAAAATVAMALWTANREPFSFGPLWGALITLVATAAWVSWLVPTPEGAAIAWRETTFGKQDNERLSPMASAGLALAVVVAGAAVGGYGDYRSPSSSRCSASSRLRFDGRGCS